MAAGNPCKLRMIDPHCFKGQVMVQKYRNLRQYDKDVVKIFTLRYEATFSNGLAEISPPENVFDGSSTAAYVKIRSANSNDNDVAGGHVRKVTIFGVDEDNSFRSEEISLNGGVSDASTYKYKRVFHMYASEWGTGDDDAAGAITLENSDQDVEISTITCNAQSTLNASDYFTFSAADGDATETDYYVWYDVINGDADPSPSGTGIEVDVHTSVTTATEVAAATVTAINASAAAVTASNSGEVITLTNDENGNVTDTADEDTGFTFAKTQDGVDPTIYLTIQATYNESDGSALWMPSSDYCIKLEEDGQLTVLGAAATGDELLAKVIYSGFEDGVDADFDYDYLKYDLGEGITRSETSIQCVNDSDPPANSKITFQESYFTNSNDGWLKLRIIIFG